MIPLQLDPSHKDVVDALQVASEAKSVWQRRHPALLPRTEFAGGSFFEAGTPSASPVSIIILAVLQALL